MYKFSGVLLFCLFSISSFSQELVFTNEAKNKTIKASIGNMMYVTYKGYNGQHEFATQILSDITDTTITLGLSPEGLFGGKRYNMAANAYKVIYIKDITAFRKRSVGGIALNSVIKVGGVVGSVFLLNNLIRDNNNISTPNAFLISLGVGLVVRYGTLLIFPVNAKYKMNDGWKVKAVQTFD